MINKEKRSFEELKRFAALALEKPELKELAQISYGSQAAYDLAQKEGFNEQEAISCAYLVKLRKHYPDEFIKIVGEIKLGRDGKRSYKELEIRSKRALKIPQLVNLATISSSPTDAAEQARNEGFEDEDALSCRNLAMIKKYYPDRFNEALIINESRVEATEKENDIKKETTIEEVATTEEGPISEESQNYELETILVTNNQWESLQKFISLSKEKREEIREILNPWKNGNDIVKKLINMLEHYKSGEIIVEGLNPPPELANARYGHYYLNKFKAERLSKKFNEEMDDLPSKFKKTIVNGLDKSNNL